jgi:hypothetical protein
MLYVQVGIERYTTSISLNSSPLTRLQYLQKVTQPHEQQQQQPRFLTSQNPAQVKRNVLASFTSILLLPVTIVPRTVGAVGTGIGEMLGMGGGQRWGVGTTTPNGNVSTTGWRVGAAAGAGGKGVRQKEPENNLDREGVTVFEVGEEDEEEDDDEKQKQNEREDVPAIIHDPWAQSEKGKSNGGEFYSIDFLNITLTKTQPRHYSAPSPPLGLRHPTLQPSAAPALRPSTLPG